MDMFDCYNTNAPICPYCGYEDVDWWDGHCEEGEHTVNCYSCGREFRYLMEMATKFETEPLEGWEALEESDE